MIYALAWVFWKLADLLDKIPGFTDATEDIYNDWVRKENRRANDQGREAGEGG